MNTSTIWYSIDSEDHPQCNSPMVFTQAPTRLAEQIAENFAMELQFITKLDHEQIKVWVSGTALTARITPRAYP